MKRLFDEYGNLMLAIIGGNLILLLFFSLLNDGNFFKALGLKKTIKEEILLIDYPVDGVSSFEVRGAVLPFGSDFDYRDYISATNLKGEDISMYVICQNEVDSSKDGLQNLTYVLHYNGQIIAKRAEYYFEQAEVIENEDDV